MITSSLPQYLLDIPLPGIQVMLVLFGVCRKRPHLPNGFNELGPCGWPAVPYQVHHDEPRKFDCIQVRRPCRVEFARTVFTHSFAADLGGWLISFQVHALISDKFSAVPCTDALSCSQNSFLPAVVSHCATKGLKCSFSNLM